MDKSHILKALLVIAACLVFAEPATAGRRTSGGRVLFVFFGSEGSVSGQFGGTRNSTTDTTEYISCQSTVNTNPGPNGDYWSGSCSARKGLNSITCTFPIFGQFAYQLATTNITSDSYISFSWDINTKVCDSLYVHNYSYDQPKL